MCHSIPDIRYPLPQISPLHSSNMYQLCKFPARRIRSKRLLVRAKVQVSSVAPVQCVLHRPQHRCADFGDRFFHSPIAAIGMEPRYNSFP